MSLLAVLLGSGHTVRTYRETGRVPLADLPWRSIRRAGYALRRLYGTHPRPDAADLSPVPVDLETFRHRVASQSYELRWPFSYAYRNEDLNARRYHYAPDREYPHRQLHIRAWDEGDRVLVNAHEEPSALHHTRVHIRSTDMTDCSRWVAQHWDNPNGLDPRSFEKRRRRDARRGDPAETGGFVFDDAE
jgi:hypothetical protein